MKKSKKIYRFVVLCLSALLLGNLISIKGYAQTDSALVEPRMRYISTYSTDLSISDGGAATITGLVRGKTGVTNTYVKVTLQKSISGNWNDIESWEKSNNGRSATISEVYQVSKGTYRVVMNCSANTESKTVTSVTRTY